MTSSQEIRADGWQHDTAALRRQVAAQQHEIERLRSERQRGEAAVAVEIQARDHLAAAIREQADDWQEAAREANAIGRLIDADTLGNCADDLLNILREHGEDIPG